MTTFFRPCWPAALFVLCALMGMPSSAAAEPVPVTGEEVAARLAQLVRGPDWQREDLVLDAEGLARWLASLSAPEEFAKSVHEGRVWGVRLGQLEHRIWVSVLTFDTSDTTTRVLAALEAGARAEIKRGRFWTHVVPGTGAGKTAPGFRLEARAEGKVEMRRTLFHMGRFVCELSSNGAPFLDTRVLARALQNLAHLIGDPSKGRAAEPLAELDWSSVARVLLVRVHGPDKQPVPRIRLAVARDARAGFNLSDGRAYAKSPCRVLVPPGRGALLVWGAQGEDEAPLALAPSVSTSYGADTRELTVRLGAGGAIAGRVLDHDGTPAAGVEVKARWRGGLGAGKSGLPTQIVHGAGRTNAEGKFKLIGLIPKLLYDLLITRDGREATAADLHAVAGDDEVEIKLPRTKVVRLQFVDPDDRPVPLVYVSAWGSVGDEFFDATGVTDLKGNVELVGLDPSGSYHLEVDMSKAGQDAPVASLHRTAWKPRDGVITMARGWTLRGTVRTPSGKPVSCTILVKKIFDHWAQPHSRSDGRFEMRGIPVGPLEVAATEDVLLSVKEGATWPWRRVEPTEDPVELVTVNVTVQAKKDAERRRR